MATCCSKERTFWNSGIFNPKGIDISIRYTGESIKNMDAYEYAREFGQTEIAEYLKRKMDEKK